MSAPVLSPRLERALAVLRALAVEGVVVAAAAAIAVELRVSTRALRDALGDLEEAGELAREHQRGRGHVMRIVLLEGGRKPEAGSLKPEENRKPEGGRKPEAGSLKPEENRKLEGGRKPEAGSPTPPRARSLEESERQGSLVGVPQSLEKSSSSVSLVSPKDREGKAEENRKAEGVGQGGLAVAERIEAAVARFEVLVERAERAATSAAPPSAPAVSTSRPSEKVFRVKAETPVWGPTDDERRAVLARAEAILRSEARPGRKTLEGELRDVTCYVFEEVRASVAHVELALARRHDVHTRRGSFWRSLQEPSFVREELAVAALEVVDAELERLRRPPPARAAPRRDPVTEWHERERERQHDEILKARGLVPDGAT